MPRHGLQRLLGRLQRRHRGGVPRATDPSSTDRPACRRAQRARARPSSRPAVRSSERSSELVRRGMSSFVRWLPPAIMVRRSCEFASWFMPERMPCTSFVSVSTSTCSRSSRRTSARARGPVGRRRASSESRAVRLSARARNTAGVFGSESRVRRATVRSRSSPLRASREYPPRRTARASTTARCSALSAAVRHTARNCWADFHRHLDEHVHRIVRFEFSLQTDVLHVADAHAVQHDARAFASDPWTELGK